MNPVRLIIFAKAPVPGRVKTRLIPAIGEQGAARLARDMLLSTVSEAVAAQVGAVELCADPGPVDTSWEDLLASPALELTEQGEGDLGERLARAAQRTISAGEAPLFIGTDCPALDRNALRSMATDLAHYAAVLQPAHDGGYVALGVNAYHRSIFDGIDWSSASVASETIDRISALGWSLAVKELLHDIDVPADLETAAFAEWMTQRAPSRPPGA